MFAFLKCRANYEMVFDPSDVDFDRDLFIRKDWDHQIYTQDDTKPVEELQPNMPKPCGKGMTMRVFVDSNYAGDTVIRRSRTGFVIFLNAAPIYWRSNKQTSCKTSSFGSDFCAMKQATEYVRGLRYMSRMMGIPVEEPDFIFGDKQYVLANTTMTEPTPEKKT